MRRSADHVHGDGRPGDGVHRGGHPRGAASRSRRRRGRDRGGVGSRVDQGPPARGRADDDARAGDRDVTRAEETVWEVFARQAYEEPLHHVGTVTEADEDLALVSARAIYDEQPWIEMIIVPRTSIREAIRA